MSPHMSANTLHTSAVGIKYSVGTHDSIVIRASLLSVESGIVAPEKIPTIFLVGNFTTNIFGYQVYHMSKAQLVNLARDELLTYNIRYKNRKDREADEDIGKIGVKMSRKRRKEWEEYIHAVRDYDLKFREVADAQKTMYKKAKALALTHNLHKLPPDELPDLE